MKIAYITMQFPTPREAAFAARDIRAVRRLGHEVSVYSLRQRHKLHFALSKELGVEDISCSSNSFISSLRGLFLALIWPQYALLVLFQLVKSDFHSPIRFFKGCLLVPRILDILRSLIMEQPDVVHLFWGHYPSLLGFLVKKKLPECKLTMFLGASDLTMNYGCSQTVAKSHADAVFTHVHANVPVIVRRGIPEEKISMVYRGIDPDLFVGRESAKIPFRIVSAGRLSKVKGFEEVLRTFAIVHRSIPQSTLVIIGDGSDRKRLERITADLGLSKAVSFRGLLSHDRVIQEMMKADIFLFMSHAERLPNVVKEAMLARCFCVVSETFGLPELLRDGEFGYLVPSRDISQAARKIIDISKNQRLKEEMLDKSYAHVAANFNVNKSMMQYISKWNEISSNGT